MQYWLFTEPPSPPAITHTMHSQAWIASPISHRHSSFFSRCITSIQQLIPSSLSRSFQSDMASSLHWRGYEMKMGFRVTLFLLLVADGAADARKEDSKKVTSCSHAASASAPRDCVASASRTFETEATSWPSGVASIMLLFSLDHACLPGEACFAAGGASPRRAHCIGRSNM